MKRHRDHKAICVQMHLFFPIYLLYLLSHWEYSGLEKFIILLYDLIKLTEFTNPCSCSQWTALRNTMSKTLPLPPNPCKAPIRVLSQLKTTRFRAGVTAGQRTAPQEQLCPHHLYLGLTLRKTLLKETLSPITQIHINTRVT